MSNKERFSNVRKAYLRKHPFCQDCFERGEQKDTSVVHQIIPVSKGGSLYKCNNFRALCNDCYENYDREPSEDYLVPTRRDPDICSKRQQGRDPVNINQLKIPGTAGNTLKLKETYHDIK